MTMIISKMQTIIDIYSFDHVYYQIAQYLFLHLDNVHKMTLSSLASGSFTSRSSVLKFCHDMGYESWKSFISCFADEVENKKFYHQILKKNVHIDYRNQQNYFSTYHMQLSQEVIERIGKDLVSATRVLICGEDSFCLCLSEFQTLLLFEGKEVHIRSIIDKKVIYDLVNTFDKNDMIFIITPRESLESLLESHELDDIIQFQQMVNIPVKKVFIGQKSIFHMKYLGFELIPLPYAIDDYLYLFAVIDFIYQLSSSYLRMKNANK